MKWCFPILLLAVSVIGAEKGMTLPEAIQSGKMKLVNAVLFADSRAVLRSEKDRVLPVMIAARDAHADIFEFVFFKTVDRLDRDSNYDSGFPQSSSAESRRETLELLLKLTDAEGKTVLHYAVAGKNGDAVKFLIRQGADPSVKDKDGKTPADLAGTKDLQELFQVKRP